MSLRRRHSLDMSDTIDLGLEPIPFTDRVKPDKFRLETRHSVHSVSWRWPVVMLAIGCLVYYIVHLLDHQLPNVVTLEEAVTKNNVFSGERSRNTLRSLTSMGPRVVGTPENMDTAPKIITDELEEAKRRAHASQSLLYEIQKGSGAYTLEYSPQFTNVYDGIQNVIAILEGSSQFNGILLNCHYDSLPTSDGATDDAISCAVILELIRVLTQSEIRLKHNIIFLFNGAEETTLQGSHMFLRHRWASTARVAINLEGAGAGGRDMLFQSGPKNAWLFNYYASSVPHPHGLILGEELFQTGVIPSVTDYAIFKDYGKMPGLDIAFIRNGYLYHSRFDKEEYVPMGSHQHMGDNTLALLRVLGNAPELDNIKDHAEGKPVYFDYLGWFMVRYSEDAGIAINVIVFLISLLSVTIFVGRMAKWKWLPQSMGIMGKLWNKIFKCCKKKTKDTMERNLILNQTENEFEQSTWFPWIELGFALCASIGGMLAGITVTVIMGVFIDGVATLAMPWFSNVWIIFPLFWCPCLAGCGLVPMVVDWWRSKKRGMSLSMTCQLNLVAAQIPWAITLIILTCMGIRSAALVMFPVLFTALANLLIHLTPLYRTVHTWVWVYLAIHIPPMIFQMYVCLLAYVIFLPTMGRSGTSNADLTIALISSGLILYLLNFAIPLLGLVRKPALVLGLLLGFGLVMLPISLTTSVGQPYNAGPGDPALQRMWIMHSTRTFYDENQGLKKNVSGFFVVNMDRNSPRTIKLGGRSITSLETDCDEQLYCGVPLEIMSSIDKLGRASSWIPSTAPNIPTPVTGFTHIEKTCVPYPSQCTVSLVIRGPIRLTMTLAPREGVTVTNWSLPTIPLPSSTWQGRPSYFIHIARGSEEEDFPFSITFNVVNQESPLMDLGLAGNYIHHDDQRTTEYKNFLYGFADWTQMTAWISSYTAYVF